MPGSQSIPGQGGKHRLGGVRDHGEECPCRSARHALALFPVANGLNGHAEPGCELLLRQARPAAKIANRRRSHWRRGRIRHRGCNGRRKGELLSIPQFDDTSIRFQAQALHIRLNFRARSRSQWPDSAFARGQIVGDAR
jgi:hypothetical protein